MKTTIEKFIADRHEADQEFMTWWKSSRLSSYEGTSVQTEYEWEEMLTAFRIHYRDEWRRRTSK